MKLRLFGRLAQEKAKSGDDIIDIDEVTLLLPLRQRQFVHFLQACPDGVDNKLTLVIVRPVHVLDPHVDEANSAERRELCSPLPELLLGETVGSQVVMLNRLSVEESIGVEKTRRAV